MKKLRMQLEVDYDPEETTAETVVAAYDRLLTVAMEGMSAADPATQTVPGDFELVEEPKAVALDRIGIDEATVPMKRENYGKIALALAAQWHNGNRGYVGRVLAGRAELTVLFVRTCGVTRVDVALQRLESAINVVEARQQPEAADRYDRLNAKYAKLNSGFKHCPICGGSGRITRRDGIDVDCGDCEGEGVLP